MLSPLLDQALSITDCIDRVAQTTSLGNTPRCLRMNVTNRERPNERFSRAQSLARAQECVSLLAQDNGPSPPLQPGLARQLVFSHRLANKSRRSGVYTGGNWRARGRYMIADSLTRSAKRTMKVAAGAVLAGAMTLCLWVAVIEILA